MQPLRHSYTNDTRGDGAVVDKRFAGPDASARARLEHAVLTRLAGRLPVPRPLDAGDGWLRVTFLPGTHGQELIGTDAAGAVLAACGRTLRQLQRIPVAEIVPGPPPRPGQVLVHGDYGPNNILLDPLTFAVTGVLDWEWAHPGDPIEDLAWCEWIIRMHHRDHVDALDTLFAGYGEQPSWADRQAAMLARCGWLVDVCRAWDNDGGVRLWQRRAAVTAEWRQ